MRETGARGLRSILESTLIDTMFDLPKLNNVEEVIINKAVINDDKNPLVIYTKVSQKIKSTGKEVNIVSKGSSLKFCLVAEGNADIYPRFAPTMEWDTAAGQAICNAVGIKVISEDTKEALLYNKENLLNPWFVVSNQ